MVQKDNLKRKILIICGATGSGKSALAIQCAKILNTEIISADSMNVYSELDIGTAKPTLEERQGIVHHLIDVVGADEEFSVSDYKKLAEPIIERLLSENKIPIICGGTGFYVNSILYDLSYGNGSANYEAREKYKKLAQENGNLYVYNILKEKDPKSAEKLHFNDLKRVIRSLEIFESGTKKSDIKDDFIPKYDYSAFAISFPREELYNRINKRVDDMITNGLVDEVKKLYEKGITEANQSMQGIGYKEILAHLKGEISLEEAIELIKLNTRHYAKRQNTFFKRLKGLTYLEPSPIEILSKRIIDEL